MACGWRLVEHPRILLEAEFHGVWRDSSGELRDVTPMSPGFAEGSWFVEDPGRRYEGHQVNGIRKALTAHPAAQRLIAARDREFKILNQGERAGQQRVSLSSLEAQLLGRAQLDAAQALLELKQLYVPGRNDPCSCGSGKKYKKCCLKK